MTNPKTTLAEMIEAVEAEAMRHHSTGTMPSADLRIERLAALNDAAETLRGMEWKPIETAPRDGTMFLAKENNEYYGCVFSGSDDERDYWESHCGQYVTVSPEPEFWMPLPPAPLPQGEGE